ncbi:hypothetical protein GOQ30_00355 [Flavobacterium sp. TP390]|uniref:SnoaL-like domain-containing protein n=1 Tax=Flavobacterium profundi TaxID=1774945 RepID=A0A6I4IIB9_9FLAO|nr:nuclear transport factor 2 family protein [Flavobacterium profundi]MVO07609.1 hypothetical protein [Flavobacterium profundi]
MKKTLTLTLLLIISTLSFGQTNENQNEKLALAYMQAYGKWDFDTMKTFYADAIHFEDPTAKAAFQQDFVFDGKENVYQFFKTVFKDKFKNDKPPYVNFVIEKVFTSGNHTIINSTFECVLPNAWFQEKTNETILVAIPFVTILTIEKGKITQHIDYGNYTKYFEQIKAQVKK